MPLGINTTINVTMEELEDLANITGLPDFFIKVNMEVYDGYLFFILLIIAWIILFLAAQQRNDQFLNNLMYSGAVVSVVSVLLRGIYVLRDGAWQGLITDAQLWIFPLVTILLAVLVYANKER